MALRRCCCYAAPVIYGLRHVVIDAIMLRALYDAAVDATPPLRCHYYASVICQRAMMSAAAAAALRRYAPLR